MDIINILFCLVILLAALFFFAGLVLWMLEIVAVASRFAPSIVAACLGGVIWFKGHDNLGIVVALIGIVINAIWQPRALFEWHQRFDPSGSSHDWKTGKKKIYDQDGNIISYEDKD